MVSAIAVHLTTALLGIAALLETLLRAAALTTEPRHPLVWMLPVALVVSLQLLPGSKSHAPRPAWCYGAGLLGLAVFWNQRNAWAGRLFVWGALCDLAGFALIAALLGWARPRLLPARKIPACAAGTKLAASQWFSVCQAGLISGTAVWAAWIAWDGAFAETGRGVALFGLAGRAAGAAAALMLVGAAIVMAWQTTNDWRRRWQYAAMAAGVLFTSSSGAARAPVELVSTPEHFRVLFLQTWMVSLAMMGCLTRFGLARVLPPKNDWIQSGRRAAPVFATFALFLLALLLMQEGKTE